MSDSNATGGNKTAELDELTREESALLAAEGDLDLRERSRILAAVRVLQKGDYYELLGVRRGANKRELRRAYFELSKTFHPDRYYSRRLGPFQPLLERIFTTATTAVKTLSDQRTLVPSASPAGGPRRRGARRETATVRVEARCSSWSRPRHLGTQELSLEGAFLVTDVEATPGERVALVVTTPDGPLPLRATVIHRLDPERAASCRRLPGIGIAFDPLAPKSAARLEDLLARLGRRAPMPAREQTPRRPRRLARGTGRVSPVIGIDLGTSYTSISAEVEGRVVVLPFPGGSRALPSVVAFPNPTRHIVGHEARELLVRDPRRAVPAVKRLLGVPEEDRTLKAHLSRCAFETSRAPDGTIVVEMWKEQYAIVQICSYLFTAVREAAEQALDCRVERAVATVPVSFSEAQIALLRRAAELARLELVEVIDEPSAAALANRFQPDFGGAVAVYDFGGGTFDFSLIDASGGDFRVLGAAGDSWLGGDDFDGALADAVANRFWSVHGLDVRTRAVEWQCLLRECERAKRRLSLEEEARVFVPEVMHTRRGRTDLKVRLTRGAVEKIWPPIIARSLDVCTQALALLGRKTSELSSVYLSGGTSYIPAVHRALSKYVGGQVPIRCGVPPELAACLGAGVHAAQLERRSETVLKPRPTTGPAI